jgi:hypothetical protein
MAKPKRSRLASRITTPLFDLLLLVLLAPSALVMKTVRRMGLQRLPRCRALLVYIGVLPVRKHYYEPFVDQSDLRRPLDEPRALPGIDWNIQQQLALLDQLNFAGEIPDIATRSDKPLSFYLHNGQFEGGDAEFLYQFLRLKKPRRFIEVGSGHSSLIARDALQRNRAEGFECVHTCIEPYESAWLEQAGLWVLRQKVEEVDPAFFQELQRGDVLFIDSSHMIRPQGDVLALYLEIIPTLKPGVYVHVHDIFTPRYYPSAYLLERMWLWNEQYLLESFLSHNSSWKIIAALNLLRHDHFDALQSRCPFLTQDCEPGSIYLQRIE